MKVRIAVLDMDGTLFRGFLATYMAEAVLAVPGRSGSAAREALRAIDWYKTGHITHDECATLFYYAYARDPRIANGITTATRNRRVAAQPRPTLPLRIRID